MKLAKKKKRYLDGCNRIERPKMNHLYGLLIFRNGAKAENWGEEDLSLNERFCIKWSSKTEYPYEKKNLKVNIHTMEYYLVIKKNKLLLCAMTCKDHKYNVLNGRNHL